MIHSESPSILATFGAGCFWGVEDTFRQIPGVLDVIVGYTGGTVKNPTYEMVCTGTTGHAEAVQIMYDPTKVSYDALLNVFWENHNPTTKDQQGPDFGSQYRSVIFTHNDEQKKTAEESKEALERSGKWKRPIVTQITESAPFYSAEEYHQQYLKKNGLSSCHY
jgi:peptide-methionine (S)-S-oxide reductase